MEYVSAEEMFELTHGRPTDDPAWLTFDGERLGPDDVVAILAPRLSEDRRATIERVLSERTNNLTVVVEGMVDLGNVSAVMRTADGFGIQAFHAIDTADTYKRSRRTTKGADKWLDRYRWRDVESCFSTLRDRRYTIVAADLAPGAIPLEESDLTHRVALVFGNELEGISTRARECVDSRVMIPMAGFSESFNISVAAALVLYEARRQRQERYGSTGDLDTGEARTIRAVWYLKSVRESHLIIQRALADGYRATRTT